jgi:hypothetical protein
MARSLTAEQAAWAEFDAFRWLGFGTHGRQVCPLWPRVSGAKGKIGRHLAVDQD